MKESGTQVVIKFSAKDKKVWEPIVDAAQDLCRKRDLYCGFCIRKSDHTIIMTIATTTHPATDTNKAQLVEVTRKVTELVTLVS